MNTLLKAAGIAAILAAVSTSLSAQWPAYPTAAVPKTADGKPDLTAPAPRTADGKPDLSGLWENRFGGFGGRRGAPPAPPSDGPPAPTFFYAGAGFKDGLPFQPWAAELRKQRTAGNAKDNPDALCLPMGFMQFHLHPQPRKMIQTPNQLVIIYEANYGLRQVFTDGRSLPSNDAQPFWYGYSIGKWEGDTLVVQSSGYRDDGWLDVNGSPYTDAMKLTERFRRVNYGTLEIEITVDDPKAYTKPWTVKIIQRLLPDQELIEFICGENQKFDQFLRGDLKEDPHGKKK
jgi:hypothetical protein